MLKSFLHLDHQSLIKTKSETLVAHLNNLGQTFTGKNVGTILDGEWSQTGKMGWTSGDNFVSHLPRSYQSETIKLGAVFDDSIQSWIGTSEKKKKITNIYAGGLDLSRSCLNRDSQSRHWQKVSLDGRENLDSFKKLVSTIEKTQSRYLDFVSTPPSSLNQDWEIC